jgi:putative effector of murein hydrolase
MSEKSDTALYTVLILVPAVIAFAVSLYRSRKAGESQTKKIQDASVAAMYLALTGACVAFLLDFQNVFEGYQQEEEEEEKEK